MGYRILVDENTSPRVAEILRVKGHTATHVHAKLNEVNVARLREVPLQRELVVRRRVVGAVVAPEPVQRHG